MNNLQLPKPSFLHRYAGAELPESFGDVVDTVSLALERVESIALLVDSNLHEGSKINESLMTSALLGITLEARDIRELMRWWLDKTREGELL